MDERNQFITDLAELGDTYVVIAKKVLAQFKIKISRQRISQIVNKQ
jgi:hypothetical protein